MNIRLIFSVLAACLLSWGCKDKQRPGRSVEKTAAQTETDSAADAPKEPPPEGDRAGSGYW